MYSKWLENDLKEALEYAGRPITNLPLLSQRDVVALWLNYNGIIGYSTDKIIALVREAGNEQKEKQLSGIE